MREQVPPFPDRWLIEDYGGDWFGLRFAENVSAEHDGRGVPEGTRRQWEDLISAMREYRIGDVSDRLAFVPATRYSPAYIHSPRNTHDGEEFYVDDPEAVADWLRTTLDAI